MIVKVITRDRPNEFEAAVNKWLDENPEVHILDMKYSIGTCTDTNDTLSVLIQYDDGLSRWNYPPHKLPIPKQNVLVYVSSNKCIYTAYYNDGKWYNFEGYDRQIPVVDFWRKLPTSPMEELK